jgi:hypothetical protein
MKWHESIDWEKHMPDGSVVFSAEQYQMLSTFHLAVIGLLSEIHSTEDIPDDVSHRAAAISDFNCEMLAAGIFQDDDIRKEMDNDNDG